MGEPAGFTINGITILEKCEVRLASARLAPGAGERFIKNRVEDRFWIHQVTKLTWVVRACEDRLHF